VTPDQVLFQSSSSATPTTLQDATLDGTVDISVPNDKSLTAVAFYVDKAPPQEADATDGSAPFDHQLDTTTLADGQHTLLLDLTYKGQGVGQGASTVSVTFSVDNTTPSPSPSPSPSPAPAVGSMQLRGDPNFNESQLPPQARQWYDRFLYAVNASNQYPNALSSAQTGDLYQLGRFVNDNVTMLLQAFRYTGDLRLLDDVDKIMQAARSQLKDYNGDGFLNWRWLHDPNNAQYYGDDWHVMDETLTHSLVAAVAWAYQNNRDLTSPSGVNYGARADFWKNYLVNDFEAKWRKRNGVAYPRMDFLKYYLMHPYTQFIRYYWYMYRLTGKQPYLDEATRRAGVVMDNIHTVSTADGPAYVWPHGVVTAGNNETGLQPSTYGQNVANAVNDLVLDGFPGFTQSDRVAFSNGAATYVVDNGTSSYAATVGGDSSVGGVPYDASISYGDATPAQWAIWTYAPATAATDASGKIAANAAALDKQIESSVDAPRRIFLSGAMFVYDMARGN